jgi:hypothetical protein
MTRHPLDAQPWWHKTLWALSTFYTLLRYLWQQEKYNSEIEDKYRRRSG